MPTSDSMIAGPFELSGGALCLDFANTRGNHRAPESDGLRTYGDLVAFARQTGIVDAGGAAAFSRGVDAAAAAVSFSLALELRRSLFEIFSAGTEGRGLPADKLERLNHVVGEALSHRRLLPGEDGLEWGWVGIEATAPQSLLWPIVESAALLLTSDELARVRECDADDCNWLFIDRSRGRTRRWCSMQSCGNRAKARRHYRRKKDS